MAVTLNPRSRRIVDDLLSGLPLPIGGGKATPAMTDSEARFLAAISTNLTDLKEQRGADLAGKVLDLFEAAALSDNSLRQEPTLPPEEPTSWKLAVLRTRSFRGLAPAGTEWRHDFAGNSHLLYGPNGCGKSSLLGAVSWCVTGMLLRDDRPPSPPEDITVYVGRKPTVGTRPDGLTLTDSAGICTPARDPYWVDLRLDGRRGSLWLRRHSETGLAMSEDGVGWAPILSVEEAGISALDAELHLLMPARVPHLRFGKDPDLVRLFSQVVGLDDLEDIADVATKAGAALSREATRIENADLSSANARIAQSVARLSAEAPPDVLDLPSYAMAVSPARTLADVQAFGEAVADLNVASVAELAGDLGIELPDGKLPEGGDLRRALDHLPGHVQAADQELGKDLAALFSSSVGLQIPAADEISGIAERLGDFEAAARRKAQERLAWGLRAAEDAKMDLMLKAAAHFPEGSSSCPVCDQGLGRVKAVRNKLDGLRSVACSLHLHQAVHDLELTLLAELEGILPSRVREIADREIGDRIQDDWSRLKNLRFTGLLRAVAERFDGAVAVAAGLLPPVATVDHPPFGIGYEEAFSAAFVRLDAALAAARRFVSFARGVREGVDRRAELLTKALQEMAAGGESLLTVLRRGRLNSERLRSIGSALAVARALYIDERQRADLASEAARYRVAADAATPTKALAQAVRQEVIDAMKCVRPRMHAFYNSLYGDERLTFDTVTTGNAANSSVKNEINVYLRSGDEQVPAAPYSNAGRLRALTLCFLFSLLERSSGSLALLVLDDPALSLDDDHKARLLDHLVKPLLERGCQVIVATHYETFFKQAEPIFTDAEKLQLAPRRTTSDAVAFEPADLLQRLEEALRAPTGSWREFGINLRRWAERLLHTISGYCPHPFVRFNDIAGSVAAYAALSDPGIATDRRDKIVGALTSVQFQRVMHRYAHDEEPTEPEARDGLESLKKCRKEADAEISRLKQLFHHDLVGRAIEERPCVLPFRPVAVIPSTQVWVEGAAAAAKNGVGVTWSVEREVGDLAGHGLVLVKMDTVAPVALVGQYLILDPDESPPRDKNLAVVQTHDGNRYVRRVWAGDRELYLQATNPNDPYPPVTVRRGECHARRVIGVLFDGLKKCPPGGEAQEWVDPENMPQRLLKDVIAIRVEGTSMEPLARDGQVVLVRKSVQVDPLPHGALACVEIEDVGAVIKRCYPGDDLWILCPVNAVRVEEPLRVEASSITRVHPLVGVLFKLDSAEPSD